MVTLRKMIYELRMLLRNNRLSDDYRDDGRLWEKWIVTQRALWVGNQLSKSFRPDAAFIQDLGSVVLSLVDPTENDDFDSNSTVLRTSDAIPSTIGVDGFDGITRVGPVGKLSANYLYVPYERARWAGGGYFNSSAIVATKLNDYIYVISRSPSDYFKYLSYINIRGVFEDPRDVSSFTYASGDSCFSPDSGYPITDKLWAYMKSEIVKGNFGILMNALSDKRNDADAAEIEKA